MNGFEENEVSKNANGGTEIAKRKLAAIIEPELLNDFQIISSRVRDIDESKIRIFWAHDLPEDPESNKFREDSFKNQFHKYVFISNWQYQRYQLIHGIPYDDKSIVIESGIEPAPNSVIGSKDNEKIRLVYTSTPQRGLEILVPVFEKMAETNPDIHLDVFSSFKIYGWDDADKQFEPLYDRIRNHPQMTYHGFVPNEQVKEHLNKSHIFAYPSIWLETSCRAMLEAMSAGLICVHPNFGALAETSGGLNMMYQGDFNDRRNHAIKFAEYLDAAIRMTRDGNHANFIMFNKSFVDNRYNIIRIKNQWDNLLFELREKYPSIQSRHTQKQEFVYRTT
jgi:glycosyltransferase involved in cell wall biosynthesis